MASSVQPPTAGVDYTVQLVDGGTDVRAGIANHRAVEQGCWIVGIRVLELGTNLVLIGYEQAAGFVEQVEQGMAIEVDPYQGAGNAALVA